VTITLNDREQIKTRLANDWPECCLELNNRGVRECLWDCQREQEKKIKIINIMENH
jgi:hypothetical protein